MGEQIFNTGLNEKEIVNNVWYIDSGCSNHMSGDKHYFVTLEENVKIHITLGNGKKEDVTENGTIVVKTKNSSSNSIHEASSVSGLTQNLLSLGELIKNAI